MRKILLSIIIFVCIFIGAGLVKNNYVSAAVSCNVASFDTTSRTLTICIGGFNSANELHSVNFYAQCTSSGAVTPTPILGSTINCNRAGAGGNLSSLATAQDNNGTYGCFSLPGINANIKSLSIDFSQNGTNLCSVSPDTSAGASGEVLLNPLNPGQANLPISNDSVQCSTSTVQNGINTAIGCIPFGDQNALIGFFLKWGIGIGGGIAFLLILAAGFQIMTSRGDPKRLQAGQELMTSAIAGLLLLIFSVVILRIIGFDIFNIRVFK